MLLACKSIEIKVVLIDTISIPTNPHGWRGMTRDGRRKEIFPSY
jgi:hypothetical protein